MQQAPPSSDGIEIVSTTKGRFGSLGAPSDSARAQGHPSASSSSDWITGQTVGGSSSQAQAQAQAPAMSKSLSQVIEIDSDSDDESLVVTQGSRGSSTARTASAPIVGSPSSDDLPDWRLAAGGNANANANAFGSRANALVSATNKPAGEAASKRTASALDKGKGKALVPPNSDDEADPWDTRQNKGKPRVVRRKRPVGGSSSDEEGSKAKPKRKAPRLSQEDKEDKKSRAAAERQAKLDAKADAAVIKKRLQDANNLQGNRKETVVEVTVHVAGTAFRPPPEDDPAGKRKPAKKEASWVVITEGLQDRLDVYGSCMQFDGPGYDYGCVGSVRWTRKCDKKWDDASAKYLPIDGPPIIVEEDARLLFVPATELAEHIKRGGLIKHIDFLKRRIPDGVNLFLMVSGLQALFAKAKNADAANYRDGVRLSMADAESNWAGGNGDFKAQVDKVELELMRVQVRTKCFIVKVEKEDDAVDWLEQLTMDVGAKPYQRLKNKHIAELGMSDEKIVSGKDLADTFVKMIASLKSVTEANARGITGHYPTLRDMYDGFQAAKRAGDDPREMLCGISKGSNANGTTSNRQIGKTTSSAIHKVFTSRDPTMFL